MSRYFAGYIMMLNAGTEIRILNTGLGFFCFFPEAIRGRKLPFGELLTP